MSFSRGSLRIYTCPAHPCPSYSTSLPHAALHLSTSHPAYHTAVLADFGAQGLELLIERAELHPTRHQSPSTVLVCLRCRTMHPTPAAAESHIRSDPLHVAAVAEDRARFGPTGARFPISWMRLVREPDQQPGQPEQQDDGPKVQYNYIYGSNPGLSIANSVQPAAQDSVLLRVLLGGGRGAVLSLPRDTHLAALPALLREKAPGADWEGLVGSGMQVAYGSVKMRGGAAVMEVKDELGWRRVMGDAVDGTRVEWEVPQADLI